MKPFLKGAIFGAVLVVVSLGQGQPEPPPGQPVLVQQGVPPIEPERMPLNTVQDFNRLFSDVAELALPSVVTILASRTVRQQAVPDGAYVGEDPAEPFVSDPYAPRPPPVAPRDTYQRALGSGVIVREDGTILTNHHVIDQAEEIRVRLHDHREVDARVIGTDPKTDIAVVKIDVNGLRPGKLGDSDALKIGEWVLCVGSPLSETLEHTVTAGIVSAKGRSNVGLADYEDYIQTDAAINPGNSGGPMLSLRGEIVGINTALASQTGGYQGVGFAVPSNMAQAILQQLLAQGKVTRGWLGVMIQDLDESLVEALSLPGLEGGLVGDVVLEGPAAKAGVRVGDVLLGIDGRGLEDVSDLRNRVAELAPGTKIRLDVVRDSKRLVVEALVEALPEEEVAVEEEPGLSLPQLGLSVQTFSAALADRYALRGDAAGVVITGVEEGSIAWKAGLREGDLVRSVHHKPVASTAELQQRLDEARPGTPLLLFLEREGGTMFVAFRVPR